MKDEWNTKNQSNNPKDKSRFEREKEHKTGRTYKKQIIRWQI